MPTPDQLAAFEALLTRVRPIAGAAADRYDQELRRLWGTTDDHDAMLQEIALQLRELRAALVECGEADEEPGPS